MGKERPGKSSSVADEMVTTKDVDTIPGKATKADDGVHTPAKLLTDEDREEHLLNLKFRIGAAGARCNDAMQAVKIHTLLKKPEDMHWAFSLLLDVASTAVTTWAIKALTKFKAGKLKDYASKSHDAVQGGRYDVADKADSRAALYSSVSDESIKNRISLLGGLAKSQAKPMMAAALADTNDKAETLSYIGQLQQAMDLAFQQLGEQGTKNLTDAELLVLFEALDVKHHSSEFYERAITEKIDRFKKSGVDRLGKASEPIEDGAKRDWVGNLSIERRVVWVTHEDGKTKSLWFYEKAESHSNARSHEIAMSKNHDGKFRLKAPVPQEFWQEAEMASEQASGEKAQTLPDSQYVRDARGVRVDHASKMNAAKVSSTPKQDDSGAVAAPTNKIFGGV